MPVFALHLLLADCRLFCRAPKHRHVSTEEWSPQAKGTERPPDLLRLIPEDVLDNKQVFVASLHACVEHLVVRLDVIILV